MPPVTDITEAVRARKDRKAATARRAYAANKEAEQERCRLSKQAQRQRDANGFPPVPRNEQFDPEDYAEEWLFLTWAGVRSDQIIERSRPPRTWFSRHVLPRVTRSRCATCGELFNPQVSGFLVRCSKTCGLNES